jgi:hypothetical protein
MEVYQREGTTFTKLADPATLPGGNSIGANWSPTGEFLSIGSNTPAITTYQTDKSMPISGIAILKGVPLDGS